MLLTLLLVISMLTTTPHHHIDAQSNPGRSTAEPSSIEGVSIGTLDSRNKFLATINTTGDAKDIAVNPATNMVYVVNSGDSPRSEDTVSVINGTTNEVMKTIPIQRGFQSMIAVNPATNMVYVAFDSFSRSLVHVIDGEINEIVKDLPIENSPTDIAVNPETNRVYLTHVGNSTSVIDGDTNEVSNMTVHNYPWQIAVNPKTNMVYIAAIDSNEIKVIDGSNSRPVKNISVFTGVHDVDVNPNTNLVYVANEDGNRISVIDGTTNELVETIINNYTKHIRGGARLTVDDSTNLVYIAMPDYSVHVIDGITNTILSNLMVQESSPTELIINPKTNTIYFASLGHDDELVYVLNGKRDSILADQRVIPTDQEIPGMKVELSPIDIAVNPETNMIYVIYSSSDTVSVIDGNTHSIVDTIEVGGSPPSAIFVNPETNMIYVTNPVSNSTTVIDGKKNEVVDTITLNARPVDVAINSQANIIYILAQPRVFEEIGLDSNYSISAIDGITNTEIGNVTVTNGRTFGIDTNTNMIYVLDPFGLTEISGSMQGITTGADDKNRAFSVPEFASEIIAVNPNTNLLYVINDIWGKRVAEIDAVGGSVINNFPLPSEPTDGAVNPFTNMLYLTTASNTLSIMNLTASHGMMENVQVGLNPSALAINPQTNRVYVVNKDSSSVSVIDGRTNKIMAGASFSINPLDSGYIECDGSTSVPIGQHLNLYSGSKCTAISNEGFEFVSWEEKLGGNASQPISVRRPVSLLDSIANFMDPDPIAERWDSLLESLGMQPISQSLGLNPYDPRAPTVNITKFGTFTANFRQLPPPVPEEFWIQSYVLVGTVLAGLSIPSFVDWIKSKLDARKLNYYHKQIASLYGDEGKLDENDIEPLNRLRSNIEDAYSEGKINDKHYESLRNEISVLYEKIFRNRIHDVPNSNYLSKEKNPKEQLDQIRDELEATRSEGKINEMHYENLKNEISTLYDKIFRKRINHLLNDAFEKEGVEEQLNTIKTDLEYAYSEGKINEKHYHLLNSAISNHNVKGSLNTTRDHASPSP